MKANGTGIRARRLARGMSQTDLATKARLSRNAIDNAETARDVERPRVSTLRKLAKALDCTVADIAVAENDAERDALEEERDRAHA